MKIDDIKKTLKDVRAPKMDIAVNSERAGSLGELMNRLRAQDRRDERYLRNKRIIPIVAGLILFTAVIIVYPAFTAVMFMGGFLVFCGMLAALFLLALDYREVGRETFDSSLLDFLYIKEKRLHYWRSTHFKYQVTYAVFVAGYLMLNLGNPHITEKFGSIPFYILGAAMLISQIVTEAGYRRRHHREHRPLLEMIQEMKEHFGQEE